MPTGNPSQRQEVMGNQSLRLGDAPADPKGFPTQRLDDGAYQSSFIDDDDL